MAKPTNKSLSSKGRIYLGRDAWMKHVSDFNLSGMTPPDYAHQHRLVLSTFGTWITKLSTKDQAPKAKPIGLVPVKIAKTNLSNFSVDASLPRASVDVTLPNGIHCSFAANHAPSLIIPWIEYLRLLP